MLGEKSGSRGDRSRKPAFPILDEIEAEDWHWGTSDPVQDT
jgi:hypothetical protein